MPDRVPSVDGLQGTIRGQRLTASASANTVAPLSPMLLLLRLTVRSEEFAAGNSRLNESDWRIVSGTWYVEEQAFVTLPGQDSALV